MRRTPWNFEKCYFYWSIFELFSARCTFLLKIYLRGREMWRKSEMQSDIHRQQWINWHSLSAVVERFMLLFTAFICFESSLSPLSSIILQYLFIVFWKNLHVLANNFRLYFVHVLKNGSKCMIRSSIFSAYMVKSSSHALRSLLLQLKASGHVFLKMSCSIL